MSAIAGFYYLDGRPAELPTLEAMLVRLAHRGPDGAGSWRSGPVGLGHRLLWTTPESRREALPQVSSQRHLVLTADVRLDNRTELISRLDLHALSGRSLVDSELILAAYQKWGEHCPQYLLGDFAFALWDQQRQILLCARDPFGVKPFYYYHSNRLFVFASEIKALLAVPEVPCRLNEVQVADYLVGIADDTATFYQDIFRLPPAHRLLVQPDRLSLHAYWSLNSDYELRLKSDEAYIDAFRDLFQAAVQRRLRSAFPVGSLLSGGLDSSAITCVARELLSSDKAQSRDLSTFSVIFEQVPECDERPFIEAVLSQGGVTSHYFYGDRHSPLAGFDDLLWHQDEPPANPNLFLFWKKVYRAVQQQDVRVLLDGFGGDQVLFYSFEHLTELLYRGQWRALWSQSQSLTRYYQLPWPQFLWRYGLRKAAYDIAQKAWRRLQRRSGPRRLPPLLNVEFARRLGYLERFRTMYENEVKLLYSARLDHQRQIIAGYNSLELETADKAAAAFAIEPRYPFLDQPLVEFCLALPQPQKSAQGWPRSILRQALDGSLPETVQWRIGKGKAAPNFCWALLAYERNALEKLILEDHRLVAAYIDIEALRQSYRTYAEQVFSPGAAETIWRAVALANWLCYTGLSG